MDIGINRGITVPAGVSVIPVGTAAIVPMAVQERVVVITVI